MSDTIYFKQCALELTEKEGNKITTKSWIPEKYAVKGKYVELKNRETGEWVNGWKVILVGLKRLTEEQVILQSQFHKKTREASDI